MELRFEANQDYQIAAIEAIADLFEGQPCDEARIDHTLGASLAAIPNRLSLTDEALLTNLNKVQTRERLALDDALRLITQTIETPDGEREISFHNFSVEMETGTGKTYVYLRTALELSRRYGMRKFIVVVPSVAIREGVLKTLQITRDHLRGLYGNIPYRFAVYDSKNISQVRQFALADSVEIMVMTIDSFNKSTNVLRQSTDRLQGETPIHLVQAARPILILDEPQDMESELRIQALAALDPLFALRYSATHRNAYNLTYRLTPYEAYRQNLVKRIEVAGIERVGDESRPFMRLEEVRASKETLTARIGVHKLMKTGTVKPQVVTVKPGECLEGKANRPEYAPYTIEEIDAGAGLVRLSSGDTLRVGETRGADKAEIFRWQIEHTIEQHFRRQESLRPHGIKALTLFFIDQVDNYALEDGVIRRLFVERFNELKKQHREWADTSAESVQAAYFATRRTRAGDHVMEDTRTGESERDKEAFDLIMRDKERLLSFEEPTCFIFSHSALGKGWDNPNIFQICTLNQTGSEMKKRQEIGRGVRLPVNQQGERVRDTQINVLTVVANESYESYVSRYQTEIGEEFGADGAPPAPGNARKRRTVKLRKKYLPTPEFRDLWAHISQKTRYAVAVDSARLIEDAARDLAAAELRRPEILIRKARVAVDSRKDEINSIETAHVKREAAPSDEPMPNLLELIASLLERTTPPMRLTRRTLIRICSQSGRLAEARGNPHEFASVAAQAIKRRLAAQLIEGITYEKVSEWYDQTLFKSEFESWENLLVRTKRALYDHAEVDTLAADALTSVEGRFVQGLEARDDVKLYFKLPDWFTVDTPIGRYNPDWAIVIEPRDEFGTPTGEQHLHLVRETKGTLDLATLSLDEQRKIACGEKHFHGALGVDFRVVTNAAELRADAGPAGKKRGSRTNGKD